MMREDRPDSIPETSLNVSIERKFEQNEERISDVSKSFLLSIVLEKTCESVTNGFSYNDELQCELTLSLFYISNTESTIRLV